MVVWCYALRLDCNQLSNGIALSQVIRTQLSDTLLVHSGIAHFQFTTASCAKAAVVHMTGWKLRFSNSRVPTVFGCSCFLLWFIRIVFICIV